MKEDQSCHLGFSSLSLKPNIPALCVKKCLIKVFSLPLVPYSGQYLLTLSSNDIFPCSTKCIMQGTIIPFVTEKTLQIVSLSQGIVFSLSLNPPHKSTIISPSFSTANDAPVS